MDDPRLEVSKRLSESQSQYIYFLMAVAASAIAICVKRTTGLKISPTMLPLGYAVFFWGLSFYAGCRNRQYYHSHLYSNSFLIEIQNGTHHMTGNNLEAILTAKNKISQIMEDQAELGNKYGKNQFRSLILGAICFLIWHIIEMIII